MNVQPYWNEDHTEYGVLVSYGFGAGWSSWSEPELAYDSRVVEFWLAHKDDKEWMRTVRDFNEESPAHKEAHEFFKSIGYDFPYMGGFSNIELEWVPAGAKWRIHEYDGAEAIVFAKDEKWNCFQWYVGDGTVRL